MIYNELIIEFSDASVLARKPANEPLLRNLMVYVIVEDF
jgi:hypothetical protein